MQSRWRPFDVGTAGACVHTCWSRPRKVVPRAAVDTPHQRYTRLAKAGQGWPGLAKAGQGWPRLAKAGQGWPRLNTSPQRYTHLSPTLHSQKSCTPCGRWHFSPTLHSLITNATIAEKLYPVRPLALLTNATLTYHQRYTLGSILSLPIVTTSLPHILNLPPRIGLPHNIFPYPEILN